MMNWRLEDEEKAIAPMPWKTKIVIGAVLCTMLICVFVADDWQQKRFATLRHGYYSMEQEQYEEAVEDFEEYLNVDSPVYWFLMKHLNKDANYSRDKVSICLEECMALLNQTYQGGM